MTTLFPIVSAAYPGDLVRVRRLVQFALEGLAILSLPSLAFSLVASHQIVNTLFGVSFDRSAGVLPVLMGAYVAICFGYVAGYMSVVTGLQGRFVWYALLGLGVNVCLNLFLIPRYGFNAAAWTTLATEMLVVGLELRAILRRLDMRLAVSRFTRALIASAAAGVTVALARLAGVPLGGLVPIMVVVYLPLLPLLGALDMEELRAVFRSRQPRGGV
jgi:O-antigen/teichoic acid export membrane protein